MPTDTILPTQSQELTIQALQFYGYKTTAIIRGIERLVRDSPEYKEWAKQVKADIGYCQWTGCVFGDEKYALYTELEVHHYPKTLYEIIDNQLPNFTERTCLEAAQHIVEMHIDGTVAVKVLCAGCHKTYHILTKFPSIKPPIPLDIPLAEYLSRLH
jgi:hypothetical protein